MLKRIIFDFKLSRMPMHISGGLAESERQAWCKEFIGARNIKWTMSWVDGNKVTYSFKDEKDAMFFALKWA